VVINNWWVSVFFIGQRLSHKGMKKTENKKPTQSNLSTSNNNAGSLLILTLALYQILSGFFLMFFPALYSSGVLKFLKPIDNRRNAFENIASIQFITNGFSLLIIWFFSCNMMFADVVYSRLIIFIGFVVVGFLKNALNSCLLILAGIELVWIVFTWISIQKLVAPQKMISNLNMPGMIHNLIYVLLFVSQSFGFLFFPEFIGEKFLFFFNPEMSTWTFVIGVLNLSNLFLWIRGMNRTCSIYLVLFAVLGRIIEVCSLCVLLLLQKMSGTIPIFSYIIFCLILLVITLFSIHEDEEKRKELEELSKNK
jgi:hypothetical protein